MILARLYIVLEACTHPSLSSIYLDRLDQYVEQRLLPECRLGRRWPNPDYQAVDYAIAPARGRSRGSSIRICPCPSHERSWRVVLAASLGRG